MIRAFRLSAVLLVFAWPLTPAVRATDDRTETWEAIYVAGQKVGYGHSVREPVTLPDGTKGTREVAKSVMKLKRFGQVVEVSTELEVVHENDTGLLVRISQVTRTSAIEATRLEGKAEGDEFVITHVTFGRQTQRRIPRSQARSPLAIDDAIQELTDGPPGMTRRVQFFDPSFQRPVIAVIKAGQMEQVQLLDRSERLRRFEISIYPQGQQRPLITMTIWTDDDGTQWKSVTPLLGGFETYRVSRDVALAEPDELRDDVAIRTLIPCSKPIDDPYRTTRAVYLVRLKRADGQIIAWLKQPPYQAVEQTSDTTLRLTVVATAEGTAPRPDAKYLAPNNYIQSDDDRIRKLAQQIAGDTTDPYEVARRLERWVYENITDKNYSVGFASAAAVAKSLKGDCTEHAVLLAALSRAVGLPARVAVGLVYVQNAVAFGGHMWTEIYIDGQWRPYDATLGLGRADAVHIKLSHSALDGADALIQMLPIVQAVDLIERFELIEAERADQ